MKTGKIYCLIDPITNEIRYIGQTLQTLHKRLIKHHSDCERFTTHVNCWLKNLKSSGQRAVIQLIDETTVDKIDELEIYYIKKYKEAGYRLTNISEGGQKNRITSDETKAKISKSLTGKVKSPETIVKLKNSLIETWKSPELRKLKQKQTKDWYAAGNRSPMLGKSSPKKGNPFIGDKTNIINAAKKRMQNIDVRNQIAITLGQKIFLVYRGTILLRANRFRKEPLIKQEEFIMEHININEACRILGIKHPINARKCLRGQRNIVEGYIFMYK